MQTLLNKQWHHLPHPAVTELLESDPQSGLDLLEIKRRQERFGPNVLTAKRGKSPLLRFLLQFHNPLIYILLAASLITLILKDAVDAAIIFGVVLVNAIVGYIQEAKAERAIEALAQTMITEATVLRAGKTVRTSAAELVPGDMVLLQAGNKVPADLRLLRARDLQVAEAALTGESVPVQKDADLRLPSDTALADRRNMAYASTLVTYGQATGIVVATGDNTEVGRISQLISTAQELETPLTRKIGQFSQTLLYVILALAGVTFLVGLWREQALIDTLMAAIALAVSAIPEGLPAAVTVTLAIGVSRMARRRAIIRKLPAVEALGSTTIICSDKTGTLTQNQMTVQEIAVVGAHYAVTGTGYQPAGQLVQQGAPVQPDSRGALLACLQAGLLCNDSRLVEKQGQWEIEGDPTEGALLVAAHKAGLTTETQQAQLPRLDVIPFESQHQYMATLHDTGPAQPRLVYVKGAVEVLLEKCSTALDEMGQTIPLDTTCIHAVVGAMAAKGLRVLAFARGELPAGTTDLTHAHIANGLTFLGLQGLSDPPRPEAVAAVHACQSAGIRVKMITGDHALTASAIARQIGLDGAGAADESAPAVLTGKAMAELSDTEFIKAAARTAVFARVTPEQKLRLVEALQVQGHIVAMTGDGVNDAPALKQSDIGVAMGKNGTDVAKEAADMVLTDDNFASIEAAVEEGRSVFDNLTKIIVWTLPTNLGEGLVVLAAIIAGVALPILPVQILWINMTTVAVLGLVLAMEDKELGIMQRPPRDPRSPILTGELIWRILVVGALILVGAFGLFEWELGSGASLSEARTVAVNVVVFVEMFYLFNCRSLTQSMFRIGVFSNRWLVGGWVVMLLLQLLFTYAPFMNSVMASAPITLAAWWRILGVSIGTYLIIEFEKWVRQRLPLSGRGRRVAVSPKA
ncbi:MAG: cation-transporting P-type ATPase [Caldilinea sp. CFX5]|nr:cation-transporting P-type ATPase [Caldilinea sp. CFX5]